PYPYRRRRRRGDLTFLPGGAALSRASQTIARPCKRRRPRRLNQNIGGEKIVINFVFFNPPVNQHHNGKIQKTKRYILIKKKTTPTQRPWQMGFSADLLK
ncbi:hypothetical protein ACVGW2_00060, partial [Enterobacter intestinihominis]